MTTADPDQPITIVVSSGNEAPGAQKDNTASTATTDTQTTDTASAQSTADTSAQQSAAAGKWRSMEMYTDFKYTNRLSGRSNSSGTDPGSKWRDDIYDRLWTEKNLLSHIHWISPVHRELVTVHCMYLNR